MHDSTWRIPNFFWATLCASFSLFGFLPPPHHPLPSWNPALPGISKLLRFLEETQPATQGKKKECPSKVPRKNWSIVSVERPGFFMKCLFLPDAQDSRRTKKHMFHGVAPKPPLTTCIHLKLSSCFYLNVFGPFVSHCMHALQVVAIRVVLLCGPVLVIGVPGHRAPLKQNN